MTLRKITIDNSLRYISKDNYAQSEETPQISNRSKNNASNTFQKKTKVR